MYLTELGISGAVVRLVQPLNVHPMLVTELGIVGAVVRFVQPANVPTMLVTELGIAGAVDRLVQPSNVLTIAVTGKKFSSPAFFIYAGTVPFIFPFGKFPIYAAPPISLSNLNPVS